ncbi:MAG: indolepyruvate ferredoxin oxidoreductase family protein [Burkholderiaceae bacterium]|nr:indolepyruvate ferredoxin oxidoreductase family protein [Burkholderiales bacterium]MCZ8106118.1 indolepyruvate ferredoxin oxidoreductase family protein [Burkholderiales bacterium]MCZ8338065.1 indolepyruvate ferredoxin oxidoreductase family protein [Burkholderiaceae bacterium]
MADPTLPNAGYALSDNLRATSGQVFLTGTLALVRLPLMQRALDARRGLATAGFVTGYRGSPLGMVDQQMWKAAPLLKAAGVEFLPAINEDLAATACLGTQRVALDPERTVEGVFAMWYGKGPGVDRSGDALKHGHAFGSSPAGGVLVVAGDDHGCVSSSMPHQSDLAMQAWSMPVLHPANVAEYLEFGLYGWALSRFSGAWVGFKAISEVVESGMTVDLDRIALDFEDPVDFAPPPEVAPLHVRATDLPSLAIEARLAAKLDAVRAFARLNSIDRHVVASPAATLGIVTVGKAHLDFMEVLRRLDLDPDALAAAGVRVYKVGLVYPLEPTRILEFAQGLRELLVIEEKAPVVERQIKELLYPLPDAQRPRVAGKAAPDGTPLLPSLGELRPSRIMPVVADWLARLNPMLDRRALVVDFTMPALLSNAADAVRRQPYFCSGCPHNRSTLVPEGSRALAGIGCHFMASWMDRGTAGLIQMGGEGVDWAAASRFTRTPHVFQNLGDGTYYHSGYLAIRQAVAAKATITYKILYNDAVAMTGGQPVDGSLSVAEIARQVEAEGAARVVVISDAPWKYDGHRAEFPRGTTFHHRDALDPVQRELRATAGVTVMIYDQTCAAEKRRRRKQVVDGRPALPDPPRRVFVNERVCEGCGDCGRASNCLSVIPRETDWGRKRRIEQSSCNKDFSCVDGFCPSFVSVEGARPRRRVGASREPADAIAREIAALPEPAPWTWTGPFDLLVTGVGGTGVVTVGALVTMAAHLEGKQASVLDFMGFAQKGGAVLSFVRIAPTPDLLNQVRIDTQQADALLACDLVTGASADALATVKHGRTEVVANTHELATAAFVRDPDASLHADALLAKLRAAAGDGRVRTVDAQAIADAALGDTMPSNVLMLGVAWQRGLVPVSLAAIDRAIELNGVAVAANRLAFGLGRLAAARPQRLAALLAAPTADEDAGDGLLDGEHGLVARRARFLADYQDTAYAARFVGFVARVREAEDRVLGVEAPGTPLREADRPLTAAVARGLSKLMAVKDEYEVARLYVDGGFGRALAEQFEGWDGLKLHFAPPFLAALGARFRRPDGTPRKIAIDARWAMPALRVLAVARRLRGGPFDLFGRSAERRLERALVDEYRATIESLLPQLDSARVPLAVRIASVPERIRGFGHVKLAAVATARARTSALQDRWVRGDLDVRDDAAAEGASGAAGKRIVQVVRRTRAMAG